MLYEMIAVVRPGRKRTNYVDEVKELARSAGQLVLANGGVVRGITNWGNFLLTKPVKRNQSRYDSGHHFLMRFDASPAVQALVRKTIAVDPRMIRCGVVRMGKRGALREVCDVGGQVRWRREAGPAEMELRQVGEMGGW